MMQKKYQLWHWAFAILAPISLFSTPSQAVTVLNVADPGITDVLFTGPFPTGDGFLGYSQAVGDFNGDGVDDLALAAPNMDSPRGGDRAGRIYIHYGGSGISNLPAQVSTSSSLEGAMLHGSLPNERAGAMMAVGDFNGDLADDLVVVGQGGTVDVAIIYVIFGTRPPALALTGDNALSVIATTTIQRSAAPPFSTWPHFQVSAIASGDLNNDTFGDLIISDTVNNEVRILLGEARPWPASVDLQTDTDYVLKHSMDTDPKDLSATYFPLYNGSEIAGVAAGDLNGDGTDDLAVGLPMETVVIGPLNLINAGRAYIIHGGKTFDPGVAVTPIAISIDTASNVVISGGKADDKIAGPLAMGKIRGDTDNAVDLVIGEPLSMRGQTSSTGLGQVQVVFGGSLPGSIDLFNQANITLRLSGPEDSPVGVGTIGFHTGQAILAQDANGDGLDDIVISSPEAKFGFGDNGWVHVVYGSNSMATEYILDVAADVWFITPEPTHELATGRMGESLALGDFDNDGRPDLAMGAPNGWGFNGGFVPLLFKPASTASCSGYDAQVTTEYPFSDGDFLCVGDNTLTTLGAVTIQSTATASFQSPRITLGAGFRVQTGAGFTAGI